MHAQRAFGFHGVVWNERTSPEELEVRARLYSIISRRVQRRYT